MPASRGARRGWRVWPAVGRLRRHGGHRALLDGLFARLAAGGYSVCVINPMEVVSRKLKGQVEGQKRSGRRAAHRRDLAHRRVRGDQAGLRRGAVAPHAHPLPPGDQGGGRPGQDSADLVMDSYLSTPAFSPTCSARRRLPSWRSRPCPPSCSGARRRRWPATSRRPPGGRSGRRRAQGRREIQRRHNPRARRGVVRVSSMVSQVTSSRSARPRSRSASRSCSRASSRSCSPSPACRWRDRRRGGRREPLPQRRRARQLREARTRR